MKSLRGKIVVVAGASRGRGLRHHPLGRGARRHEPSDCGYEPGREESENCSVADQSRIHVHRACPDLHDHLGAEEKVPLRFGRVSRVCRACEYVGRAVAAVAADNKVMQKTGQLLWAADLAREYGFTGIDGRLIPRFDPNAPQQPFPGEEVSAGNI